MKMLARFQSRHKMAEYIALAKSATVGEDQFGLRKKRCRKKNRDDNEVHRELQGKVNVSYPKSDVERPLGTQGNRRIT